ncbi:MAG: hypothetical protein IKD01_02215 [Oscillospiraceae bacterium]|nr:hypothetical protein [Oscillospiraceae bacterium]
MSENKTPVTPQQKKVYLYIIVLFTAAFLLILWSFFATHRSNQQVLDEVRGNADVVESALEENQALSERNKILEDENDRLRAELAAALMREVQLKTISPTPRTIFPPLSSSSQSSSPKGFRREIKPAVSRETRPPFPHEIPI